MLEKQTLEAGQAVLAARMTADTRRRWDEVRQMRDQVLSRQEQVIQQTRADVRRHVERMRTVRAAIISPEAPRPVKVQETAPRPASQRAPASNQRFDFDGRREEWEQRRRERAEMRKAEIALLNEPYQQQRRLLEEKRRLALLNQQSQRRTTPVGAHQLVDDPAIVNSEFAALANNRPAESNAADVHATTKSTRTPTAVTTEHETRTAASIARDYRQNSLFAEEE